MNKNIKIALIIGDITSIRQLIPTGFFLPKAGGFADEQARVVARNISGQTLDEANQSRFDGKGFCYLEMGDGMNSKYGMMCNPRTTEIAVTSEQTLKTAQDFPDMVFPGTKADDIVPHYGYYTIMTTLEGEHYGMLSINGYSPEVWYHTWHGIFISEVED